MKGRDHYFTFLLRLLPASFRARHGPELRALLTQMKDDLGPSPSRVALMRLYAAVTWDLLRQSRLSGSDPAPETRPSFPKKGDGMIEMLVRDIRYAARGLLRTPGHFAG